MVLPDDHFGLKFRKFVWQMAGRKGGWPLLCGPAKNSRRAFVRGV